MRHESFPSTPTGSTQQGFAFFRQNLSADVSADADVVTICRARCMVGPRCMFFLGVGFLKVSSVVSLLLICRYMTCKRYVGQLEPLCHEERSQLFLLSSADHYVVSVTQLDHCTSNFEAAQTRAESLEQPCSASDNCGYSLKKFPMRSGSAKF